MDGSTTQRPVAFGAAALLLSLLFTYVYASWSQQVHYIARLHLDVHAPLEWVQQTQRECLARRGRYCTSLEELMETAPSERAEDGRWKVEQHLESPSSGRFRYRYAIEKADADTFKARATVNAGDDIWTIGPEGPATAVTQSDHSKGLPFHAAARWAGLLTLAGYLGLLATTAIRLWRAAPAGSSRVGKTAVLVVAGLAGPVFATIFVIAILFGRILF